MPSNEGDQQQGKGDFREQAKSEVREAIKKAEQSSNPEQAKKEIAKQIVEQVTEVVEEAKEVVENEEKAKKGQEAPVKQKEKESVAARFIKLTEAVKQGVVVAKKPEAQAFLQKVVEEIPSPSTSQANHLVAYLSPYLLGEKDIIINPPDQPKSEFQKDFELLASVNPQLAERIKEALRKGVEDGKIVINKDKINQLVIPEEELKEIRQTTRVSYKDEDLYKFLAQRIGSAINNAIQQNKLSTNRPEDLRKLQTFLFSPTETNLGEILPLLLDIGITQQEAQQYQDVYKKLFGGDLSLETLIHYAGKLGREIERAQTDFSLNKLLQEGILSFDEKKGHYVLTREGRLKFQKKIGRYYYTMLKNIHQERSSQFSEAFQKEIGYSYYQTAIRQIVRSTCEQLMNFFKDDPDTLMFLRDKASRYQSSIMSFAQILHDIPLMARSDPNSIEKWAGFFNALFPSQLAEIFDEGDERIMEVARSLITSTLRERLALNKNYYPNNLYTGQYEESTQGKGGVYWHPQLESELRERLVNRLNALGIKVEDWEIERALTYGLGIGYLTLIDPEVLTTSEPEPGNFKGIHPLLPILSAKFNWGILRGYPYAGLVAKYLMNMDISLFPEVRKFLPRLWSKKRFVPKELADEVDKKLKGAGEEVMKFFFQNERAYRELISLVNFATSLLSRGGWRVAGGFWTSEVKETFENFDYEVWRTWRAENWFKLYDTLLKNFGATALWWGQTTGPSRLDNELKRLMYDHHIHDDEFDEFLIGEFRTGERSGEKIFEFEDVDGQKKRLSIYEIKQKRMYQVRAEMFYRYLLRNPGDFFLLFTQMAPEILDDDIFLSEEEYTRKYINKKTPKTRYEIEQFLAKKSQFEARWGKEGVLILRNIREWLINQSGAKKEDEVDNKKVNEFIQKLVEVSGNAFERLRGAKGLYLTKEMFDQMGDDGKKIGEAIFGEKGLIKILTGLSDTSETSLAAYLNEDNFGSYKKGGKPTIFYLLAQTWSLREGDINPFASDTNYYGLFKNVSGIGEDVLGRLTGDAALQYKEVITKLPNLEHLLIEAAKNGSLEEINKLHEAFFNVLKGSIGLEAAYKANFLLAQIVSEFFQEHSILRDPKWKWLGPIGWLLRETFGHNISLSKLLTHNRHAYSMDNNALRTYFMHLAYDLHVLPVEGVFSKEQLEKVFEVTTKEFIIGDVGPTLLWFIILFLLFNAIKKGLEEAEGKKK